MLLFFSLVIEAVFCSFLLLTSVYFFLAYLPYTFVALINAPPYAWLIWFSKFHQVLAFGMIAALWFITRKELTSKLPKITFVLSSLFLLALGSAKLLLQAKNNASSLVLACLCLTPVIALAAARYMRHFSERGSSASFLDWSYLAAALTGIAIATFSALGSLYGKSFVFRSSVPLFVWSLITHIALALTVAAIFNTIRALSRRGEDPVAINRIGILIAMLLVAWFAVSRFVMGAFSVQSSIAYGYGLFLACALVGSVGSLALRVPRLQPSRRLLWITWGISGVWLILLAALPWLLRDEDWNLVLHRVLAVMTWIALFTLVFNLLVRPVPAMGIRFSLAVMLFAITLFAVSYSMRLLWSRSLGPTEDDITRALNHYGESDVSFRLAFDLLTATKSTPCGELCTLLRQHTNLRAVTIYQDLNLVDRLVPTVGEKPNIFIFVVDSVRPDYLGAYNQKVDFTPHIDKFASESVIFRNAFTPYAGTTMAEPAIWTGALLLHSHYPQPFERINTLEKLAVADDYQMFVSWDTVLRVLLKDSPRLHKLDEAAIQWNHVEMCATVRELKAQLSRSNSSGPIFFYSQPMNVHQFANNTQPLLRDVGWKARPGFSNRISFELNQVDACFGDFIDYLKAKKIFENSIVILVSDHGDATGELGRSGHSIVLYPEVMRIPFIIHLPAGWQDKFVFDTNRTTNLTDITPSLYYLLGERPVANHPLVGRPIFTATRKELDAYKRPDLFFASDVQATYGLLDQDRFFYATYDLPERSYLYDLQKDPFGERDILTPELKRKYDRVILQRLKQIDDFYGYHAPVVSWFASN